MREVVLLLRPTAAPASIPGFIGYEDRVVSKSLITEARVRDHAAQFASTQNDVPSGYATAITVTKRAVRGVGTPSSSFNNLVTLSS